MYLHRCLSLLLLLILLTCHAGAVEKCELKANNTILTCWNRSEFPDVEFYDLVTSINFYDNNFIQLNTSIFDTHHLNNLTTATIRNSNITVIATKAFANMHNMLTLHLLVNNLTILQNQTFFGLPSLQHLDLSHNEIVTINAATLRPLTALKTLDLSFNSIRNLAADVLEETGIYDLSLSNNPIQFSEGEILKSTSLTKLSLKSCNLKILSSEAFNKLPKLQFLDLSKNKLKSLPGHLFSQVFQLKQLDLSYNPILYLSMTEFAMPSKMQALLCNQTPLEGKCQEVLKTISKGSTNFRKNASVPIYNNKNKNSENEMNITKVSQPEFTEQRRRNIILIILLLVFLLCPFGFVIWKYSQKQKYVPINLLPPANP